MTLVDTESRILEQLLIMDQSNARSWCADDPWKVLTFNALYGSSSEKSSRYIKYLQYEAGKEANEQSTTRLSRNSQK